MDQLKDKILEERERKREKASKGWSRLFYMIVLLLFIIILLYKTNTSKFDVLWNILQGDQTEQVQE
jgi:uncharacterized integral membrane protein